MYIASSATVDQAYDNVKDSNTDLEVTGYSLPLSTIG